MPSADKTYLAADVGASKTLVALVRPCAGGWSWAGEVRRFATPRDPDQLAKQVCEVIAAPDGSRAMIAGAGVAIPGPLDAERGIVTHLGNLAWRQIPLAQMLAEMTGAPVRIDDDARLGAVGEYVAGAGRGCRSLAYVTISTGIGCGLVLNGAAWPGSHGLAGEFGHIVVNPAGPRCGCGKRGCIEAFAGGLALARAARRGWPKSRLPDGTKAPRSSEELFAMAHSGDPGAAALVAAGRDALSFGLAAIVAIADPEVIVVGGSIALSQPRWLNSTVADARRRCIRQAGEAVRVVPAALAERSALAGAAELAIRHGLYADANRV